MLAAPEQPATEQLHNDYATATRKPNCANQPSLIVPPKDFSDVLQKR
jgi:hypothetical protein